MRIKFRQSVEKEKGRFLTGFTLVEILVYVFVLFLVVSAASSYFSWAVKASGKARAGRETISSVRTVLEVMSKEIREAESVYSPTSIFSANPGQLSLETKNYIPAGESAAFVDFFLCDTRLCFKKEGEPPVALTSEKVSISNLVFTLVATNPAIPSFQIDIKADYINPGNLPELNSSFSAVTTASLKSLAN